MVFSSTYNKREDDLTTERVTDRVAVTDTAVQLSVTERVTDRVAVTDTAVQLSVMERVTDRVAVTDTAVQLSVTTVVHGNHCAPLG